MNHKLFPRLTAAALSLTMLLPLGAQALTPEQAADLLQKFYVNPVPKEVTEQETIDDMLRMLGDRYTQYFTPEEYKAFVDSMSDTKVVGIGITCQTHPRGLLVTQLIDNLPAKHAGILPNDVIVEINGTSLEGMSLNEAAALLKGEIDTKVEVSWLRDNIIRTANLTRTLVVLPTVTTQLVDGHIGYMDCSSFGTETVEHMKEGLDTYAGRADAWIVDLRGNPGGYVNAMVDAVTLFTNMSVNLFLRSGNGSYIAQLGKGEAHTLYPIIMLVDGNTASSAELFAASVRDHGCGIVVGSRTFGKGLAQTVLDKEAMPDYFADGDAMKISSYRAYSIGRNTTDQIGVVPDLMVPADKALEVAMLLAGSAPTDDTSKTLRADMGWQFFIDLNKAMLTNNQEAFRLLLNAYPDSRRLMLGTGGLDGWQPSSPSEVAAAFNIPYAPRGFADSDNSRFFNEIDRLAAFHMLDGREDGLFHPEGNLTRAELCLLLGKALGCFVQEQPSPFTDVAEDAWYKPAVTSLYRLGLVNGVGGDRFAPDALVTHQEFITILARTAAWLNMSFSKSADQTPMDSLNTVAMMEYDDWAKPGAWLLASSQEDGLGNKVSMLWDDLEDIDPDAPTRRDEAACAFCRLLAYTRVLHF